MVSWKCKISCREALHAESRTSNMWDLLAINMSDEPGDRRGPSQKFTLVNLH